MKQILLFFVLSFGVITFYTIQKAYTNIDGRAGATGAPGETTCSQSNCHGAGAIFNPGFADNAGPGAVTISSSNMTDWSFVPGETYHLTVVNSDQTASVYGVCVAVLDNTTNKSTGSLVITDHVHTQIKTKNVVGSTRQYVTHKNLDGATTAKPATFSFDWIAPVGVNSATFYFASNAANDNGNEDGEDNIYTGKQIVTLAESTGIKSSMISNDLISIFPNPAQSTINIRLNGIVQEKTQYTIYSVAGMKMMDNIPCKSNNQVDLENWNSGRYFVQMNVNGKTVTKTFFVE